jgi:hypothetical protein
MSVRIHHGWFEEILQKPVWGEKFVFIPVAGDVGNIDRAGIEYVGCELDCYTFPISKYIKDPTPILSIPTNRGGLWEEVVYPAWVRARIPAIFGAGLPLSNFQGNSILVEQTFIACQQEKDGSWNAYVFICEQCYAGTETVDLSVMLSFSKDKRYLQTYKKIAADFWQLLLSEPNNLHPFFDLYLFFDGLTSYWRGIEFNHVEGFYDRIIEELDDM